MQDQEFDLREWLAMFDGYLRASQRRDEITPQPSSDLEVMARDLTRVGDKTEVVRALWRPLATATEAGAAMGKFFDHLGGMNQTGVAALARIVLLGAARTIYLLAPDEEPTRTLRFLEVANGECDDYIKALHAEYELDPKLHPLAASLNDVSARKTKIEDELAHRGYNRGRGVKEVVVLTTAAEHVKHLGVTDGKHQAPFPELVSLLWNDTSAVSHARGWHWDGPRASSPADREVRLLVPSGSLLACAWELWQDRAGIAPSGR